MKYAIFDIALYSNIELPELPRLEPTSAQNCLTIQVHQEREFQHPQKHQWLHHWHDRHGIISASYTVIANGFVVAVPDVAEFVICPAENIVHVYPLPKLPAATLRHALLDQIVPMYLGQQGRQVLHASAVEFSNGRVVAFVGDSGLGKSTLASALAGLGGTVLTDDCLLLEDRYGKLLPIGNYPGIRLHQDAADYLYGACGKPGSVSHYSSKTRLPVAPKQQVAVKGNDSWLDSVFILTEPGRSDHIKIRMLSSAEDMLPIIKQHFYIDIQDKQLLKARFAHVQRLINSKVSIFSLDYPRRFEILSDLCERIISQGLHT